MKLVCSSTTAGGKWCIKIQISHLHFCLYEQGRKIGQMFKALTPEEKAKYEELANKDKTRFQDESKAYSKKEKAGKEAEDDSDGVDEDLDADDDDDDSDSD